MIWRILCWFASLQLGVPVLTSKAAVVSNGRLYTDAYVIQKLLDTSLRHACEAHSMVAFVQRQPFFELGISQPDELWLLDKDHAECSAQRASNRTHFVISTLFDHCGTVRASLPDGRVVYHNKIQIWRRPPRLEGTESVANRTNSTSSNDNELLASKDVKCVNGYLNAASRFLSTSDAAENVSNSTLAFRLEAFDTRFVSDPILKYPHNVKLDQDLFVQLGISSHSPGFDVNDLRALPLDCFLSKGSASTVTPAANQYYILRNGCPAEASVALIHTRDDQTSRASRFVLKIIKPYFDLNAFFFLNCRVVACSVQGKRDLREFPRCPNNTACSRRSSASHQSVESARAAIFDDVPRQYTPAGPFRIVVPQLTKQPHTSCPPCPATNMRERLSASQSIRPVIVNGLTIPTVIGISIAAFVVGLALMGGLWFIHEKTTFKEVKQAVVDVGELRQARLRTPRRHGSRDSGVTSASPSTAEEALFDRYKRPTMRPTFAQSDVTAPLGVVVS